VRKLVFWTSVANVSALRALSERKTSYTTIVLKRDAIERALPVFEQAESSAKLGGSYNISTRILERKGELTRAQEDLRVAERAMEIVNKT